MNVRANSLVVCTIPSSIVVEIHLGISVVADVVHPHDDLISTYFSFVYSGSISPTAVHTWIVFNYIGYR